MVRISVALLLAVICIDGFSQTKKSANVSELFSIKGEPVTTEEFMYLYKKNHQGDADFTKEKIEEYLELFINFKLKVKEAKQRGLDTTTAFIKEYTSYKEELRKPYLPEGKILDSLVKITYDRLQEEVRISHILISVKPDASPADTLQAYSKIIEIKNKAAAGEDFGSLAAQYSQEPMASTSKGDLGYFTAMQMVYPFENAAYSGKPGDLVGPVRTRFGYHILKIINRKPARGEVEVSHIMIRTTVGDDKAKNQIFEIYDQLRGGMNWEELCKQYSEDPGSKNSGGKLRPFGVGAMAAVPEFDRVAFSLQKSGDISDPFQTQYGWHIVRLERKIPVPSFAELGPSLKGRVARDERVQVSKQALMQKLKKDFSFNENEAVKKNVFALADTLLIKGKWKIPAGFASGKETIFSLNSKNVTAHDFLDYVQKNQRATTQAPNKYIEQLYNLFVDRTINEVLEEELIRTHPDFVMLLREYHDGILLFEIMEKEVWKKASEDSLGQVVYFQGNAKKYTAGERAASVVYSSNSKEALIAIQRCAEKGDTTGIQKIIQAKSARQEIGTFQKQDRPLFSKIDWKPGTYSTENSGMYYLVQIQKIVPPGPLSFEESRAQVISDYQENLEKKWLAELKKKFPVKVNEKAKKYVFENLKM